MVTPDEREATLILEALGQWHAELNAIGEAGNRLRSLRSPEVDDWRHRLIQVKADIKDAAKTSTLDGRKRAPTELERCYYSPAVRHASANFRMRTDAPPSKWSSGVFEPASDLSYWMHRLKADLKTAT